MLTLNSCSGTETCFRTEVVTGPKLVREPCATKLSLKTGLQAAMDEIIVLTVRHIEAVRDSADLGVQDLLERHLASARDRKDNLLELYKIHTSGHHC